MSDPRIDPNYRGVKCKGCGEYLPFLLTDLCAYCTRERDKKEIKRLQTRVEELEAKCSAQSESLMISNRVNNNLKKQLDE